MSITIAEGIMKWEEKYPFKDSLRDEFVLDLCDATGAQKIHALSAAQALDWDFAQAVNRLCLSPEEWRLKYEALEKRVQEIEATLQRNIIL